MYTARLRGRVDATAATMLARYGPKIGNVNVNANDNANVNQQVRVT